jgi:mannose-6-phosphate isomerase-like protein (cupin superfamily)
MEKLYVVLEGEVTISNGTESVRVRRWDSVRIAPNEPRQLKNETEKPASILLAMPLGPMTPA